MIIIFTKQYSVCSPRFYYLLTKSLECFSALDFVLSISNIFTPLFSIVEIPLKS
jgi:hypothetical protein